MAENARSGMRAGGDFFQIRAANAAGVHAQQQLSGADLWNRNSLQADVIYSAVNRRQHGGGDRMRLVVDCDLSGNCHRFR